MSGNKTPLQIELTPEERQQLERRTRSQVGSHRDSVRAQVILLLADGHCLVDVAQRVKLGRRIVRKWGQRFEKLRLKGLDDRPRPGRPSAFSPGGGHAASEVGLRAA